MTLEVLLLVLFLILFLVAVYSGAMRIDLAAILLMLALVVPWQRGDDGAWHGILTVRQGFSGFGSTAVVMVVAMFVISAAMEATGAAAWIGEGLLRRAASSELRLTAAVVVSVTFFSAVVSDTTSVLVWMPLVLAVCRDRGFSSSRILMPLAFAALLGGQWTLIGTRTNIVLSDFLRSQTGEGLGFLDFTPVAALNWVVVAGFLVFVGRRLLPAGVADSSLADRYEVQEYLTEVIVSPGAEQVGTPIGELDLGPDVRLLGLVREGELLPPASLLAVRAGDTFVVQGRISRISRLLERPGIEVREEMRVKDQTLRSVDLRMVEGLIAPGSSYAGRSLRQLDFHERTGLSVLAISRAGRRLAGELVRERLRAGDSLLFVGHEEMIQRLRPDPNLVLLESRALPSASRRKAVRMVVLVTATVAAAALRLVEPALAVVLGAAAAVVTGCIGMRQVYASVDWRIVFVLGGMIPFALALEETGGAAQLAQAVTGGLGSEASPVWVFGALLAIVLLLTQVVENTAAAVVIAPVAYRLALEIGADPKPFLLGTALCASAGFSSPMAHECTLLVMGPGGYRPGTYLRLGVPAALITGLVTWFFVPRFFPF